MTRHGPPRAFSLVLTLAGTALAAAGSSHAGADGEDRIGLADLAAYRAALSGRATADDARPDDPIPRVGFRDLWDRPELYRGRRVSVAGRLQRRFRQGAIGSFPPLVEAWIFSEAGDPFCLVYPLPQDPETPEPGRIVRFTGTFLKTIRYAAGDGDRLAPLIVGDTPPGRTDEASTPGDPTSPPSGARGDRHAPPAAARPARTPGDLGLGLVLAGVVVAAIAAQMLRSSQVRRRPDHRRLALDRDRSDPPLRFVESPDDHGVG